MEDAGGISTDPVVETFTTRDMATRSLRGRDVLRGVDATASASVIDVAGITFSALDTRGMSRSGHTRPRHTIGGKR